MPIERPSALTLVNRVLAGLDAVTALGDGTVMIVGTSGAVLAN